MNTRLLSLFILSRVESPPSVTASSIGLAFRSVIGGRVRAHPLGGYITLMLRTVQLGSLYSRFGRDRIIMTWFLLTFAAAGPPY